MDAARHRTWIIVEVVAIVVAVAVGAFLGVRARNSDDVDQAATTLPAVVSSTTATPAPTTTTIAPAATIAPPTAATTPVPPPPTDNTDPATTTIAPTTTTTTTLPPLTAPTDELLAAVIPIGADIPADWFQFDDPIPNLGPPPAWLTNGFCLGPSHDQLAADRGAVATAWYDAGPPANTRYEIILFGFPSADAAGAFVDATSDQIAGCGGTYTEELPEGDGSAGTFDGFYDDNPPVVWTIAATATPTDLVVEGADDAFGIVLTTRYSTTVDGAETSWIGSDIYQYERFGPIVVIHSVGASHDFVGFNYANPPTYVPTEADASGPADMFRDLIVSRLETSGLIHPS